MKAGITMRAKCWNGLLALALAGGLLAVEGCATRPKPAVIITPQMEEQYRQMGIVICAGEGVITPQMAEKYKKMATANPGTKIYIPGTSTYAIVTHIASDGYHVGFIDEGNLFQHGEFFLFIGKILDILNFRVPWWFPRGMHIQKAALPACAAAKVADLPFHACPRVKTVG